LAGPVVAAALVFDRPFVEAAESGLLAELTDSKQLTRHEREFFYDLLIESPFVEVGLGIADAEEIDRINILRATHSAMARAIQGLVTPPDHVLVDGLFVPGLPCSSTPIVDGDAKSLSIAAASVVAKVTRDAIMTELARQYPQYGFEQHKGYGTRAHTQALLEHGASPVHRRTFRPVRDIIHLRSRLEQNGSAARR
jgi:ribonuclease HII